MKLRLAREFREISTLVNLIDTVNCSKSSHRNSFRTIPAVINSKNLVNRTPEGKLTTEQKKMYTKL